MITPSQPVVPPAVQNHQVLSRSGRFLAAMAVVVMGSQVLLPTPGVRVGLADIAVALAAAAILFGLWRHGSTVRLPLPVAIVLVLYCLAGIVSGWGRSSVLEVVQRIEQLLCGVLVLGVLLHERPRRMPWLVAAGLAVNLAAGMLQLRQGFGPALTGLFHSRMAFSLYLAATLAWLQPFLFSGPQSWVRQLGTMVFTAACLGFMAHGQMLLLGCAALLIVGFLHSQRAAVTNMAAVVLVFLLLAGGGAAPGSRSAVLLSTLSPMEKGMLKQAHVEVVAAFRMAAAHPACGVGPGRYQEFIGTFYRELPRPHFNAIERDTQSGFGILLSTAGIPAGLALVLLLVAGIARGLEGFYRPEPRNPVFLAGAGCLLVLLVGMLVSDPFVRGLGWLLALGLACVFYTGPDGDFLPGIRESGWRAVCAWGVVCALALAGLVAKSATTDGVQSGPDTTAGGGAVTTTGTDSGGAFVANPHTTGVAADIDFFKVLGVEDNKSFTPPFVLEKDPRASKGQMLHVPDEKGTPPDGVEPDMKYGGVIYEIDVAKPTTCKIWVRVWWEGSCGNSLYLVAGKDPKPVVVGNDGTYDAWHWLEAPQKFELDAGKQEIRVLNREDGIRLDQVLVTGDLQYVPQGVETE